MAAEKEILEAIGKKNSGEEERAKHDARGFSLFCKH